MRGTTVEHLLAPGDVVRAAVAVGVVVGALAAGVVVAVRRPGQGSDDAP